MQDFQIDYRGVLTKYTGKAEYVKVPDDVIYIGKYAFLGCNFIRSIELPEEVVHIYSRAFLNCKKLERINLPPYLADIGEGAFCGCSSLKQIQLPRRLEKIEQDAFQNTGLEEITIPKSVQKLGSGLFQGCTYLKKAVLPENMEQLPDLFFAYCSSLSELHIPDSVTKIGTSALVHCTSLKQIRLPDNLEYLNNDIIDNNHYYELLFRNIKFHSHANHKFKNYRSYTKVSFTACLNAIKYYLFNIDFLRIPVLERISILLQLLQNTPEDKKIEDYFKKNLTTDALELLKLEEFEIMQKIIEANIIQKEHIDTLIRYAIDHELYEIQVMLTNYKREKIGFESIEEIANKLLLD